jgi:hypothetical protein
VRERGERERERERARDCSSGWCEDLHGELPVVSLPREGDSDGGGHHTRSVEFVHQTPLLCMRSGGQQQSRQEEEEEEDGTATREGSVFTWVIGTSEAGDGRVEGEEEGVGEEDQERALHAGAALP